MQPVSPLTISSQNLRKLLGKTYPFYVFFAVFILFSACKRERNRTKAAAAPLALVIPDNASVVISADFAGISKKANLEELLDMPIFQKIEREFFRELGHQAEDFMDLFFRPEKSGINLNLSPFFFIYENAGSTLAGYAVSLKNPRTFKKKMEDLIDKDAETEEKYAHIIEDKTIVGWNETTAVFLVYEDSESKRELRRQMDKLFEQEKSASLQANANFKDFLDKEHDLGLWVDVDEVGDMADEHAIGGFYDDLYATKELLADNYFHGYLNFEKNKIKMSGDLFLNETIQDYYDRFLGKSVNPKHLQYLPKNNLIGLFGMSLNMRNIINELEDLDRNMDFEKFAQELGMSRRQLRKLIKGDATIALTGYGKTRFSKSDPGFARPNRLQTIAENTPEFVLVADVDKDNFLTLVQRIATKMNNRRFGRSESLKIVDGIYVLTIPDFIELYFIMDGDRLVLSNSMDNLDRDMQPMDRDLQNLLTDGVVTAYWNLNIEDYPRLMLEELQRGMNRDEYYQFKKSMSLFKYVVLKGRKNGADFELCMNSKRDENSLFVLMKFLGELEN